MAKTAFLIHPFLATEPPKTKFLTVRNLITLWPRAISENARLGFARLPLCGMGNKRRILLALLPAAFLAWFALELLGPHEPVYQGKPVSLWVAGYMRPPMPGRMHDDRATDDAVRQIGTNAIPTLLRMLRARDSALKLKLLALARKQPLIKINSTPAAYLNSEAARALQALGPGAWSAVPALIEMYDQTTLSPPPLRMEIAGTLGRIGPLATAAVPSLLRGTSDPDDTVRGNSLFALGRIQAEPELVVPALIKALSDSSPYVRMAAAEALEPFGSNATRAVPALVQLLHDTDENPTLRSQGDPVVQYSIRRHAEDALKAIDPEAAAKAGVK